MAVYANDIIQDALATIDVVAPGEPADPWWNKLAIRLLNGLLKEWSLKGIYNPTQTFEQMFPTVTADYFTVGVDASVRTLSTITYTIIETADPAGIYYKSIKTVGNKQVISYNTTGAGTTYSLVVNADTAGTFYVVNGGYSQKAIGDIPVVFSSIYSVQLDLGTVVYTPTRITLEEYMGISVKQTQSTPAVYAYDYQLPMGKLYFWPKALPNLTLRIVGQASIDAITNNQSTIPLDDSMYTALLWNLAAKLYPFLKREGGIDQEIIWQAKTAMSAIRSRNLAMRSKHVRVPFAGTSTPAADYWVSPLNTVTR